jgi:NADPH:quinone reductase-like Zn-dependent oxidoreductase
MSVKKKVLGQDPLILAAVWANIVSWFCRTFAPHLLPKLVPHIQEEQPKDYGASTSSTTTHNRITQCIIIGRPGGVEQLRLITLKPDFVTCGYNLARKRPFLHFSKQDPIPDDCVIIQNEAFSVNYADCCIRWGLYESAAEFVGYPICPGFDIAGTVQRVGKDVRSLQVGDRVMGCSLFGAYSTRIVIPEMQLRKIPSEWTFVQAAALPTVALTALYALFLAGQYPNPSPFTNRSILIHSAAGGVGSMLVQMARIIGLSPIVGVVGRTAKVQEAKELGCDVVIDKSTEDLWAKAEQASPKGYATIIDANGVATIQKSYDYLAPTGRLIVLGFHTNLPVGKDSLSPLQWIKMALNMSKMPKFDPMDMTSSNKAVLAFNLSFFSEEREMLATLFTQILDWVKDGKLQCPRVVEMPMKDIGEAHQLIQSGKTIGKIVLKTNLL